MRLSKLADNINKILLQHLVAVAVLFGAFFISACTSNKPESINYGHDSCNNCKMTIADKRFGGELITKKGKVFKFDSLECLNEYINLHTDDYKIYVVDSLHSGNFIEAEKANFEIHSDIRSPMGQGILASPRGENDVKGTFIQWKDLQPKLKR